MNRRERTAKVILDRMEEWINTKGAQFSQDEIAEKLSIDPSTLSQWLNGHRTPNYHSLRKVDKFLKPIEDAEEDHSWLQ